jgi:hypothetical protein
MTAYVAERAHDAVAPAHSDDRSARRFSREIRTVFRESGRGAERNRESAQEIHLGGEAIGREIVLDRLSPYLIAQVGGLIVDVIENALDHRLIVEQSSHEFLSDRVIVNSDSHYRESGFTFKPAGLDESKQGRKLGVLYIHDDEDRQLRGGAARMTGQRSN